MYEGSSDASRGNRGGRGGHWHKAGCHTGNQCFDPAASDSDQGDDSLVSMPSEFEAESSRLQICRQKKDEKKGEKKGSDDAARHQKLHDNEDESAEDASSVDTQGMHNESEDESETLEMESRPEFVIKQDWAVRWEDDLPAESVTQAKDGKAVFHWLDGDIYYSQDVLYTEATASRQGNTKHEKDRKVIQEARKACEHHGDFKVSVLQRPKFSNGGWEVVLKTNKNGKQIWSMTSSHSKPVADSLLGTVKWANRLAHSKCVKAKEEEALGLCDESEGTVKKEKKANKGRKSSPSKIPTKKGKVTEAHEEEENPETVTEGEKRSHEEGIWIQGEPKVKMRRKKRKKCW